MTDYETPKFPPMATPEDVKAASEKVMNFWVGALSPMWVPFWAASSFGLSAWAMSQSLSKGEGLLKDMPLAGKWPGFGGVWHGGAAVAEDTVEKAAEAVAPVVAETEKVAKTTMAKTAAAAEKTADTVTEAVAETVDAAPEPAVVFDPVIEAPVAVEPAAVAAPAVLKEAAEVPVKAAAKVAKAVEPKPIAKAVSAVKKPKA